MLSILNPYILTALLLVVDVPASYCIHALWACFGAWCLCQVPLVWSQVKSGEWGRLKVSCLHCPVSLSPGFGKFLVSSIWPAYTKVKQTSSGHLQILDRPDSSEPSSKETNQHGSTTSVPLIIVCSAHHCPLLPPSLARDEGIASLSHTLTGLGCMNA
jgi:hypothetical protein